MKTTEKKALAARRFEEKQLASLRKKEAKGTSGAYFIILLFIIAFVNIIDEVTSNLSVSVQSSFVTEFFVNRPFLGSFIPLKKAFLCIPPSALSAMCWVL